MSRWHYVAGHSRDCDLTPQKPQFRHKAATFPPSKSRFPQPDRQISSRCLGGPSLWREGC